jgi:hypothetical protein
MPPGSDLVNAYRLALGGVQVQATANELNYLRAAVPGSASSRKAMVADADRAFRGLTALGTDSMVMLVYNDTGSAIDFGKPVALSGAASGRPTVVLADADLDSSDKTIGLVATSSGIANGANGYVCLWGILSGIDTSGFTAGDELFVGSTAGSLANSSPAAVTHLITVGRAVDSAVSGTVFVWPTVRDVHSYGDIHVHDNSTAQSIPNGATYTKLTALDDSHSSYDCTSVPASSKITITRKGAYKVNASVSGYPGTANVTFEYAVFLGGVEQDQVHSEVKLGNANDRASTSMTGFIEVTSVPVDLDLRARHDDGAAVDFTYTYGSLNIVRMIN